jgi:hypothetical protein
MKKILFACVGACLAFLLNGCAAESGMPIAVTRLGGDPPKAEEFTIILDGAGMVNGNYVPGYPFDHPKIKYPIHYEGKWVLINTTNGQNWVMMRSETAGSEVNVVSSASRVVFDFYDHELYQNPGVVTFALDGKSMGQFDLAKAGTGDAKIMNYSITTNKDTVSTVTMKLVSGQAVMVGYLLVYK